MSEERELSVFLDLALGQGGSSRFLGFGLRGRPIRLEGSATRLVVLMTIIMIRLKVRSTKIDDFGVGHLLLETQSQGERWIAM